MQRILYAFLLVLPVLAGRAYAEQAKPADKPAVQHRETAAQRFGKANTAHDGHLRHSQLFLAFLKAVYPSPIRPMVGLDLSGLLFFTVLDLP